MTMDDLVRELVDTHAVTLERHDNWLQLLSSPELLRFYRSRGIWEWKQFGSVENNHCCFWVPGTRIKDNERWHWVDFSLLAGLYSDIEDLKNPVFMKHRYDYDGFVRLMDLIGIRLATNESLIVTDPDDIVF